VSLESGSGKPDLINLYEVKKYFWHPAISGRQPYIYEVLKEYLGFPGEPVGSVSPWPELWQHREPQPAEGRGVFYTNYPRKIMFSKTVTFKTSELPRWKPKTIIGLRTFEEKNA
jgi:hypothetical protein